MVLERKLAIDENDLYCPVRATLALLGQKWVPHIIHELMSGKRRFNELAHNVGGCNSRTLRDRLKNLEELDIVDRNIVAVMPPVVKCGSRSAECGIAAAKFLHSALRTPHSAFDRS